MNLIKFQDYPSTETPLNAENLNHNFNELNKDNIYSTEETFTGKYWIDGKKIYRKVLDLGALPNTETKTYLWGISNIEDIVNAKLFAVNLNDYQMLLLPYVNPYTNYMTYWITIEYLNKNQVQIVAGANRSNYNLRVILEYTKTTD